MNTERQSGHLEPEKMHLGEVITGKFGMIRKIHDKKYLEYIDKQQREIYGRKETIKEQLSARLTNPDVRSSIAANPFIKKDAQPVEKSLIDYRTLEVFPASAMSPRPTHFTSHEEALESDILR